MCLGYLHTSIFLSPFFLSHSLMSTKNCLLGTMNSTQHTRITVGDTVEKLHSQHQNMLKDSLQIGGE